MSVLRNISFLAILFIAFSVNVFSATFFSVTGATDPNSLTSWNTAADGSGIAPGNFSSGDTFIVQPTGSMTTTAAWAISGTGNTLQVQGTLQANHLITVTTFQVDANATYIHNAVGTGTNGVTADFPGSTRTLSPSSNVEIRSWATTGSTSPVNLPSIAYGNLTINVATLGGSWNQVGGITSIGNLTILATGGTTRQFRLTGSANVTTTINNVTVSGGILGLSSGTGTALVNVNGNYTQTGGTLDLQPAGAPTFVSELRVKGDFTVSGSSVVQRGSSSNPIVILNGTSSQNFSSSVAFGSGVGLAINGSNVTLQSNVTLGAFTSFPGLAVNGTLNTNGRNISAGKIYVACRSLSACAGGSFYGGGAATMNLQGGTITMTNSNTIDVMASGVLNSTGASIITNNSGLSGLTVTGTATLTDTIFNSAGTTLNPIIVNTSATPVSNGVVNVRGASTITTSGVSTTTGATFNWTDAGSLTSVRKTSLFATSGTLTLGTAGVTNSGTFTLNGATANCLEAGDILVRSSTVGTARSWTGAGTFNLTDVDLQDQNSTPTINVLTGNNSGNNTNFNFNFGPVGTLAYNQTNYNVSEGQTVTITVQRPVANPCGLAATVDYSTFDDTAIAGTHYTATSGTLSFAQGVSTQTYTVSTTAGMGGAGKVFRLGLTNQSPASFAENSPNGLPFTTVTILAPTAAGSLLKGRLLTSNGRGLSNAQVVLTNTNTGEVSYARSSAFGHFRFEDLPTGDFYILEVPSKRYRFTQQSFTLNGDLTDLVLTAQP